MKRTAIVILMLLACVLVSASDSSTFTITAHKNGSEQETEPPRIVLTNIYDAAGEGGRLISSGDTFNLIADSIKVKPSNGGEYTELFQLSIFTKSTDTDLTVKIDTSDFTLDSSPSSSDEKDKSYVSSLQLVSEYYKNGVKVQGEGNTNTYDGGKSRTDDNALSLDLILSEGDVLEFRVTGSIAFGGSENNRKQFLEEFNSGAEYKLKYTITITQEAD